MVIMITYITLYNLYITNPEKTIRNVRRKNKIKIYKNTVTSIYELTIKTNKLRKYF